MRSNDTDDVQENLTVQSVAGSNKIEEVSRYTDVLKFTFSANS